jgi:hypothetical protein
MSHAAPRPPATDLLGRPLTATEQRVLAVYDELLLLLAEPDLAPSVAANLREAAATLWQVVQDQALPRSRPDL